jgi:hypothetical protein
MLASLAVAVWAVAASAANPKPAPTPAPGIYFEPSGDAAGGALEKLETSTMTRVGTKDLKKGIASTMLTGGLLGGPKMAYLFAGARAQRRVAPQAWFQFHFDPKPAAEAEMSDSEMPAGARQPFDFALVRLNVKDEERELVVGMDMKPKNTLPFRMRQLGPTAYRVAAEKPLPPGEYAFYAVPKQNAAGGSEKVWDFGVDKD